MNSKPVLVAGMLFCLAIGARAETRIVFSARTNNAALFDLYTMDATGGDVRQLTRTTGVSEWGAAIAPDRAHVAYVDRNAAQGSLYVGELAGGNAPRQIAVAGRALAVEWIDASTLVYLRREGSQAGTYSIRRIGSDGTGDQAVYAATYQTWDTGEDTISIHRPSGRIYFGAQASGRVVVRSGLLTGTGPDRTYARGSDALAAGEPAGEGTSLVDHYDPAPSPDDRRLAFAADHGSGSHRIYTQTNNAAVVEGLSRRGDRYCGDPAWAPDGAWIVFTRAAASTYGVGPYIGNLIRNSAEGAQAEQNLTSGLSMLAGRCGQPAVYEAETALSISASAGANGFISPTGTVQIAQGASQTYTISASAHYHVADVKVDGVSVGAVSNYTFSAVTASHTIQAVFAIDRFSLAVTSAFGSAVPANVTTSDWNTVILARVSGSPAAGAAGVRYLCTGWTGSGSVPAQGAQASVRVILTQNSTLAWQWKTQFLFTALSGPNGTVSATNDWYDQAAAGISARAIPDAGYHFAGWTGTVNSTANPLLVTVDRPCNVTATFAVNRYSVTATAGAHGSISPGGVVSVACIEPALFTITPDLNYRVQQLLVDGLPVEAALTYTFPVTPETRDRTLEARFELDCRTPAAWRQAAHFTNELDALDAADPDRDGYSNLQEFVAGSDPANPRSVFGFSATELKQEGERGVVVRWPSVSNRTYRLRERASLAEGDWTPGLLFTSTPPWNVHTGIQAGAGSRFYQLQVWIP